MLTPTIWPTRNIERSPIERIPTELLHEVFEPLDRKSLLICMQVCRRWYDVARLYFFAVVPVRHRYRQQAFKCIHSHPGFAARVTKLHFFDKSCGDSGNFQSRLLERGLFDIGLLKSALPLLINLRALRFDGYDTVLNRPSLLCRLLQTRRRQNVTASLQRLSFEHCGGVASMMPELLSLFSVNTLVIDVLLVRYSLDPRKTTVPPPISPASITIRNLVIGLEAHLKDQLSFFERILVPGSLRGLATARCSTFTNRFLQSGACRNLHSISITVVSEEAGTWPTVVAGTNGAYAPSHSPIMRRPLNLSIARQTVCMTLGAALKHCPRLQYIRLGFIHRGDNYSDLLSNRDTLLPILTNLPRTLRVFAVNIWLYTLQPWCCTSTPAGLYAIDHVLSPGTDSGGGRGGRFSELRRVELDAYQDTTQLRQACMKPFKKHDPEPLPRLYAAGLLRYGIGNMRNDKPRGQSPYPLSDLGCKN